MEIKESEKQFSEEDFDKMKERCSNIVNFGNSTIIRINLMILEIKILKLLLFVIGDKSEFFSNELIFKMKSVRDVIKNDNVLLKEIEKIILNLEKNKITYYNVELCKLLECIFEREASILAENGTDIAELALTTQVLQRTNKKRDC